MVINENLSTQDKIILDAKDVAFRYASVFMDNLGLIDGETYTFSADLGLSEGREATIIIFDKDYNTQSKTTRFSTDKRNSLTFVYKENTTNRISCYAGVAGNTNGINAKYTNIKLEKGDKMTPYIPNKNAIETAKRQYFIGGGYVQRGLSNLIKSLLERGLDYVS